MTGVTVTRPEDAVERPPACPACASVAIRPFVPTRGGVDYRCRCCGWRWFVAVAGRD